jgi:hypothetical protein
MNEQMMQEDSLLQLIPIEHLSLEQKSFRPTEKKDGNDLPMYKMIRELTHLNDLDWKSYSKVAIWRDNNTPSFVFAKMNTMSLCVCSLKSRMFALRFGSVTIDFSVRSTEKRKRVSRKTVVFLWSLKESKETKVYLEAWTFKDDNGQRHGFDFAALQPNQLAQVLDANPQREFELYTGTWSPELSVILATRPQPVNLHFVKNHKCNEGFRFTDEGTAFINALEDRKSSFGSLSISYDTDTTPLSSTNFERLLQLGRVVEKTPDWQTGRRKCSSSVLGEHQDPCLQGVREAYAVNELSFTQDSCQRPSHYYLS